MLILALFAMSFNLVLGYGGRLSFGHAAFYGVGGYTVGLLATKGSVAFPLNLMAAPILGAVTAFMIGYICSRTRGFYFAMLTFALAQVVYVVAFKWYDFTGGDNGIQGIPVPSWLAGQTEFYYLTLVLVAASIVILWRLVNSPFGHTLQAMRENSQRTEFIGINVDRYQLIAFVISGFFCGLAGGLSALLTHSISPQSLFWTNSAEPIFMTVLGGMFTFIGPAIGAILLVFLDSVISSYTEYWAAFLGITLILAVLFFRRGVAGFFEDRFKALGAKLGYTR
jgi:branched-chain amino acid transport system permease protein